MNHPFEYDPFHEDYEEQEVQMREARRFVLIVFPIFAAVAFFLEHFTR